MSRLRLSAQNMRFSMRYCRKTSVIINPAATAPASISRHPRASVKFNAYLALLDMPLKLIGVGGQMRMGKDTLGDLISAQTGLQKEAFSKEVKNLARQLFRVENIDDWKLCPEHPPGMIVPMRQALQCIGDGMRQISPTVWIDLAMQNHPTGIYCDVRYANEAQTIRQNGGILILIGRTGRLNDDFNPSETQFRPLIRWFLEHTSESLVHIASIDNAPQGAHLFDWFVRNDGTIEDLREISEKIITIEEAEQSSA